MTQNSPVERSRAASPSERELSDRGEEREEAAIAARKFDSVAGSSSVSISVPGV